MKFIASPGGTSGKDSKAGKHKRWESNPLRGRSPGGGNGNPLAPVFLLGESYGQGSFWATVHRATQNWTRLKPTELLAQGSSLELKLF